MSTSRLAFAALFIGATAIGFAPLFVRLSEVGPCATAFYRLLFALPALWLWMTLEPANGRATRRPSTEKDLLKLALTGLFFTADLGLWHWSLRLTNVANSTIGARLLFQEQITGLFVTGMILAMAGAALLVGGSFELSARHVLGDALALSTAISWAAYMLMVKHLRRSFSTATIMSCSGVVACAGFWVIAWVSREMLVPLSAKGWLAVVALAFISHVGGQTLITYAFGHLPASFTAITLLWQPVVAALAAWVALSEPLSKMQIIGGTVVLLGVGLARGTVGEQARPNPERCS